MAASRIATETTGVDTAPGIGPKVATRSGDFRPERLRDARPDRVQTITVGAVTAGDEFTITGRLNGASLGTTIAFTAGTDMTAAAMQTALRTLTGDTGLTVTGTTDVGPFVITHTRSAFTRHFPRYTTAVTGMTAAVSYTADPVNIVLGESKFEGTTALVGPTIGTITVTAGTDEVQTLDYSAGTDGGTFRLRFRRAYSGVIDWDADAVAVQAEVDAMFSFIYGTSDDAPTVAGNGTAEVQTIELGDIGAADTYKLTADAVATGTITYALDGSADILAALIAHPSFRAEDITSVVSVDDDTYTVTFAKGFDAPTLTITNASGFTPTGVTATTAPVLDGFTFTFESGRFAGRPVRGGMAMFEDELLDTPVEEPATLSVTTPGVLGSASAAYTEQATVGDSVFVTAVNDETGTSYTAQKDAASPAVVTGLPPGVYTLVARTVADKQLSAPSTKAFTVTST